MENDTSLWEIVLTWIMLGGMFGGAIAASLWAQRRRRDGREANSYNAEGADAMVHPPTNTGGT